MFIEREAYLQEFNRREMIQALEAKRLVQSVQSIRPQSRGRFSHKVGRSFQVLHERVQALVGVPKVA